MTVWVRKGLRHTCIERAAVSECTWEYVVKKWTVEKVNGMYLKIAYRFIFPAKGSKQRRFETMPWKSYLNSIVERKKGLIGEVAALAVA